MTQENLNLQHVVFFLVMVLSEEDNVVRGQRVEQRALLRRAYQVRPLRIGGLLHGEDARVRARGLRIVRCAQERRREQR